jgi:hypothetical protein
MARFSSLPAWTAAFALATMAANAHANPLAGSLRELGLARGSNVEEVASRVCWRETGFGDVGYSTTLMAIRARVAALNIAIKSKPIPTTIL